MDARIRYTKMMVKQEFLKLLNIKTLEKITVKEICERAGINRATFYKYYDNPFDLLEKLEDELLNGLQAKIDEVTTGNLYEVFKIILTDIKENEQFYRMNFAENSDTKFRKRIFEIFYGENMKTVEKKFSKLSDKEKEWMYYFVAEGSNGILKRWIDGGLVEPVEEIAGFTERVIRGINEKLPAVVS